MKFTKLSIPEVVLIEPVCYEDSRGMFYESFNLKEFEAATGILPNFVQDNHSRSLKGVLRGLHFQRPPSAQGKLVRVVRGEVYDVAVDIREGSATYGDWVAAKLSAENKHQLWIPEGFAHGFITLSESADFLYKTTDYYSPKDEASIYWDDETININWPVNSPPILSEKDKCAPRIQNIQSGFYY